jgi:uncharacterized membrane protein YfcA
VNDDLNIWMKLESGVSAISSVIVLAVGIVAFIRKRNPGWLLLSLWSLFSLIAGVVATYLLPEQPGQIFAFTGIVASVLLAAGVYMLARSDN